MTPPAGEGKRNFVLASSFYLVRGEEFRDILETDLRGLTSAYLTVPNSCAVDILEGVRKAYANGRDDFIATGVQ